MKPLPVVVENAADARFECVFPTCGGICCKNGRPPVEAAEVARIEAHLPKFLPHLRPAARARIERDGFMTRRVKDGLHTLAVSEGWCVFENGGCVLHKVGLEEGASFQYKPWRCAAFPYEWNADGSWFVRQHGLHGEVWDLFCLNPRESKKKAVATTAAELPFLAALADGGSEAWRFARPGKKKTTKKKTTTKRKR